MSGSTIKDWVQARSCPTIEAWAQGLLQMPVDRGLTEVEAFVDVLCAETNRQTAFDAIECARPFLHKLNPPTGHQAGVKEARRYIRFLEAEIKAYEHVLSQADQLPATVLSTAIHRSLVDKIEDHITHYRYYLLIPERKWLRIHRLFYLAVKNKIPSHGVPDKIYWPGEEATIMNLYCYLLLLSCARLSHFSESDIVKVSYHLKKWCHLVRISKTPNPESKNQIVVDIATGSAPNFTKLFSPTETSIPCYLQIDDLLISMNEMWIKVNEKEEAQYRRRTEAQFKIDGDEPPPDEQHEICASTIEYLRNTWSGFYYQDQMQKTHTPVEVCIGIEHIHFYLSGAQNIHSFLGEKADLEVMYDSDEDANGIEKGRMSDLWSTFLADPKGELAFNKTPAEFNFQHHFKAVDEAACQKEFPRHPAMMTEVGPHECKLIWHTQDMPLLELGELIGLRSQVNDHWQVCEVDWKIQLDDEKTVTGIKIISTQAIPVGIDVPYDLTENYFEAILTPPEDMLGSVTSVISCPRNYKNGDWVSLTQKNLEEKAQLIRHIKKNEHYERCECAFLIKQRSGGTYLEETTT